jgi:hypothetical protein
MVVSKAASMAVSMAALWVEMKVASMADLMAARMV